MCVYLSHSFMHVTMLNEIRNPLRQCLLVCPVFATFSGFMYSNLFNHLSLWYCNHPATIICTENSFWHQSTSCPFIEAFKIAFQSYISTGMQEKLKMALLDLCNIKANKKIFHQEFTQKVLDHRLCILFFTFFSLMLILFCDAVHPEDMKSEPGSFNVN
jgi:hypothetical protein